MTTEIIIGLIIGLIGIIVGLIGTITTLIAVYILLKDRRDARIEREQYYKEHDEIFDIYRELMAEKGVEIFKMDTPIDELPTDLRITANRYRELISGWGMLKPSQKDTWKLYYIYRIFEELFNALNK